MAGDYSSQELLFLDMVGGFNSQEQIVGFSSQEQVVGFNSQEQEEVEGKKKERWNSVGPSSTLEMRPLSNLDIEDILKGITNYVVCTVRICFRIG